MSKVAFISRGIVAVAFSFLPHAAFSASGYGTAGAAAEGLAEEGESFIRLIIILAAIAGLICFLVGAFMLYKDSKQPNQGHGKSAFIGFVVGIILVSPVAFMNMFGGSLTGGEATGEEHISPYIR